MAPRRANAAPGLTRIILPTTKPGSGEYGVNDAASCCIECCRVRQSIDSMNATTLAMSVSSSWLEYEIMLVPSIPSRMIVAISSEE